MIGLHFERENNLDSAWNIVQWTKSPNMKTQTAFENDFLVHKKKLQYHDDRKLEQIAESWVCPF